MFHIVRIVLNFQKERLKNRCQPSKDNPKSFCLLHCRLSVAGYNGNAGDSLAVSRLAYDKHLHNGRQFTTKDSDNDRHPSSNCAAASGAWWFSYCYDANLNGPYMGNSTTFGIVWWQWKKSYESLKSSEMKLK